MVFFCRNVLPSSLFLRFSSSGFGFLLGHFHRASIIFTAQHGALPAGLASQSLGLFQGVGQGLAQGLRQQQGEDPDDEGQHSYDQLHPNKTGNEQTLEAANSGLGTGLKPEVGRPRRQPGTRRKAPPRCPRGTSCCRCPPPASCREWTTGHQPGAGMTSRSASRACFLRLVCPHLMMVG